MSLLNGKSFVTLSGMVLTLLGFVGGLAYRSGQDANRLETVENALTAHIKWAEIRSTELTRTQEAASNASLAVQQMAGDMQEMKVDVRQIRDYFLRQSSKSGGGQ